MLATLYHLFPPTIHPMVIHFTIAIIYLTGLAGFIGLFWRRDDFFSKLYFMLLILSIIATIAAGVAGVISEYYVNPQANGVAGTLAIHKRDGELTGVLLVISFGLQVFLARLQKVSFLSFIVTLGAMAMVSVTGFIGGSMVYDHGLGVHVTAASNATSSVSP